jgi:hypothetical protein
MEFNYDKDTAVDPDDLVEEWLGLSNMFFNYNKELAGQEKKVKKAHEKVKVTRSRLLKEAKEQGAKNDAEREAYYRQHDDHQEAKKELIDAEYDRDLVKGAIGSFYRKETAMLEVGKLIGRIEHFRHPKEPVDIPGGKRFHTEALTEDSKKRRKRINQKQRRR